MGTPTCRPQGRNYTSSKLSEHEVDGRSKGPVDKALTSQLLCSSCCGGRINIKRLALIDENNNKKEKADVCTAARRIMKQPRPAEDAVIEKPAKQERGNGQREVDTQRYNKE